MSRLACCLGLALAACSTDRPPASAAHSASAPLSTGDVPASAYRALSWRLVGPLRGGWATTVAGVPGQPATFYFGSADGGVWKTTDAGRTWTPSFQHESVASIGDLEVAPSDPRTLYAGTGQVTTRWDAVSGDGVYRSKDGGATWEHRGLEDTQHVGRLWVDPRDADVVLAAALGHLHGPNEQRGVFRSTDGGAHWEKVLFVDRDTGAVDLAADPAAPDRVFAATWQARRFPWQAYFTPMAGPGSAIHRSTDGGKTWTRLSGRGLPAGPLGRIGLAVARNSGGLRVYATIDAGGEGGLFASADGGDSWQRVNKDGDLANDYFSRIAVDPRSADTVFVMGRSIRRSKDGGKTFEYTRGAPGGDDYHDLWIDPEHPERQITGSDQGAVVTLNDGASWSSWYNQPTGQFYRLATDDRFPYWIYSGQQDSGTVALASRSDYGQLTFRDWHPVGGDERDCDIPFPGDPDVVFGSGLGGRLTRFDSRTGQVTAVSPWPVSSYGARPETVRYRSTWITPIAISPHPPHAIYLGAQVLFESKDRGDSWSILTGDVTGAVPGARECSGDVPVERATACGYGVIYSIAVSPCSDRVLWIGTDNGRVHLSRDGGSSWTPVTPPDLPDWSKVAAIDAPPHDPASAYLAVDRHRLDDLRPYVYVTHDSGATWRMSSTGLPAAAYVNVVRADPERPGLLYAGTRQGVYVSFDDGASWRSLQLDLPTTGINDIAVHGDDVLVATQGRGIWALDGVAPLRHLDAAALAAKAVLFPPSKAWRLSPNQNKDTPLPADEPRAQNPPSGAVIDYLLAHAPRTEGDPVVLEIADADGKVVRTFRSGEPGKPPPASRYFTEDWIRAPAPLPAQAGHNRFVWDLRLPRPRALEYEFSIAAVPGADLPELPQGIFVLPGEYRVRLTVDGKTLEQPLEVGADPRAHATPKALEEQLAFYRQVVLSLESSTDARIEIDAVASHLRELPTDAARKAAADLEVFRKGASEDNLGAVGGVLGALATDLEGSDAAPTQPQRDVLAEYGRRRLSAALEHWRAFRARLAEHGLDQGVQTIR